MWGESVIDDVKTRYVLVPILRGDSPLMMQIVWVKGCLDETGGDWEKRAVICIPYGVWGERVPSEPNGGRGVGRVTPSLLLDISRHLMHNLAIG
jgi:hypothetical protein